MHILDIDLVSFETTRRCNLKCGHCMRGKSQNINMNKEIVDSFFDTKCKGYILSSISYINFSGGEPTLNYGLIIYIINKIIEERIPVENLQMTTNGHLFIPELIDAFNKFNEYRNITRQKDIRKHCSDDPDFMEELIKYSTDGHVKIAFSTDRFHTPVPPHNRELYRNNSKGLIITDYTIGDENLLKSGYSSTGKDLKVANGKYQEKSTGDISYFGAIYITVKGEFIFGGDGSYDYIDSSTLGKVDEVSIVDLIKKHSYTPFYTPKTLSK